MYFSSKRQQYLIDQGYSYCMQSDVVPLNFVSKLNGRDEELSLLQSVLCSGAINERETRAAGEEEVEVEYSAPFVQAARAMSALTGADDDVYIEYSNK